MLVTYLTVNYNPKYLSWTQTVTGILLIIYYAGWQTVVAVILQSLFLFAVAKTRNPIIVWIFFLRPG